MPRFAWRTSLLLIICCCLFSSCGPSVITAGEREVFSTATPSPTPQPPAPQRIKIMPLGDSITSGRGSSTGGGYRLPLWNDLAAEGAHIAFVGSQQSGPSGFDPKNEGHPNWCIDQIAARVVGWLETSQPHIILLHIGTNDMMQQPNPTCTSHDPANARARLSRLVDQITTAAPTATLIVAQITPLGWSANSQVIIYNAAIPGMVQSKVSQGKHVGYVDMYDAVPTRFLADKIHPNDSGYALMAGVWNKALLPLLHLPQVAQRDVHAAEAPSLARSMLSRVLGKGSEIPLPYGNGRALPDVLKPDCC